MSTTAGESHRTPHERTSPPSASLHSANLGLRLSIMMFLQFAIWGAWAPALVGHMEKQLGFSGTQVSYIYLTTAIGAILSPVIAGWIADRFVPNQIFTGVVHLVSSAFLYLAYQQRDVTSLFWVMLGYSLLFMPTLATTNAIAFHPLRDARSFGLIRMWGTLGWVAVGFAFSFYLQQREATDPSRSYVGDCLLVSAVLALVMGLYCLTLPHTPPSRNTRNPYAFLEAFTLTSNRNFLILLVISFVVAIELPFYYNFTFSFFTDPRHGVGLAESTAFRAMLLGQIAEMGIMVALGPAIARLGMRNVILLGILAWPLRYTIFAIGEPAWLVVASQALHGVCYAFFFAAGMIAVERLTTKDKRASAQGLMLFATFGVGMLVGSLLAGQVVDYFTPPGGARNWTGIFLVPVGITVVAAMVFAVTFSEQRFRSDAERIDEQEAQRLAAQAP